MRKLTTFALFVIGCTSSAPRSAHEFVHCSGSDIPIYAPRFAPQAGGSGVATGSDAAGGAINSSPSADIPAADPSLTAMTETCGQADCPEGQVAVEVPVAVSGGGGGGDSIGVAGPSGADPSSTAGPSAPSSGDDTKVVCADPPPTCAEGLSPQYTEKGTWECTDCTLVVSYGGLYGNYRRCVSAPDVECNDGEVPTWVYEDDSWECQPECDNGQYDQHMIGNQMVCIPC